MCGVKLILFQICLFFCCLNNVSAKKPHILYILVDDVGFNDFGYHGSSQIPTPNIDALAYNGIVLNKHYTMHICTPSRTALLTGLFPMRTGMQGFPLSAGEPRALPTYIPTMAERLRDLGYKNHLVGKWHLGHQNRSVTPLGRGFHSHVGYWNGFCGYFNYHIKDQVFDGFDLHRDFTPSFADVGTYATDLFTKESIRIINQHPKDEPLFLYLSHLAGHTGENGTELGVHNPEQANKTFSYIDQPQRRLYAEVIKQVDDSVGKVVEALSKNHMLDDTIIVFSSDNGAQSTGFYENFGSNWPFRGLKFTLFEGGVRNSAIVWSKRLKRKQYVENTPFHMVDWLPTLYAAAGEEISDLGPIDGVNQWPLLYQGLSSNTPRSDILLNIDDVLNFEGILSSDGRFKLTNGSYKGGIYNNYYGDSGRSKNTPLYNILSILASKVNLAIINSDIFNIPINPLSIHLMRERLEIHPTTSATPVLNCTLCLFDLKNDPTETTDVSNQYPDIKNKLQASLDSYRTQLMPQTNKAVDPDSNPKNCFGTWFPWLDTEHKCDWINVVE